MTEPTIVSSVSGIDITGQVAVVTGGSAGLGKAIAMALAGAGATVVVASRHRTNFLVHPRMPTSGAPTRDRYEDTGFPEVTGVSRYRPAAG
jgi:nucleoside-diphosphate-sugar epimerase